MPYQIQLRNGRIFDAIPLEDGSFEVMLTGGPRVYTPDNLLRVIQTDPEVEDMVDSGKEGHMEEYRDIYHYLRQFTVPGSGESIAIRFIADNMPDNIAGDYHRSLVTKRVSGDILAIESGSYRFSLVEEELMARTRNFSVMILRNADLARYPSTVVEEWVGRAAFGHANADYSFFLKVDTEWGLLDSFGLTLDMKKKSAKRAQEIYRHSETGLHLKGDDAMNSINISVLEMDGFDVKLFDGMSYINQKTAIRIARTINDPVRRRRMIRAIRNGKLVRVTLRVLTPNGLIKGDAIIVPNNQIDADIVTHIENLKTELLTDDYIHIVMWEHHTSHMALWDDQSTINFGRAMPESKHLADLHRLYDALKASLDRGELPEWLLIGERDRDDDGIPDMEKMSDIRDRQWVKVQAAGYDIRSFQNLVYMSLGGLVNRMRNDFVYMDGSRFYRKMWIPMTNAVLGSVVTYDSATIMGGFTFDDRDPNTVFFDPRVGMVIPGRRFIETFDAHGTWDLDDSAKFIWIKLWASGDYDLHRGITIPTGMELSNTAEGAIDALLVVRSPNGPGEYSIEIPDLDGMFADIDLINLDQVVTVDLCAMPKPQEILLAGTMKTGLNPSTLYSGTDMTRVDAVNMIRAQLSNPGVGRFCNAMMVWAAIKGPSFPVVMADVMGNVVDTVQMGFDLASFNIIEEEPSRIMEQLLAEMETNTDLKLDKAIAATRANDPAFRLSIKPRLIDGRLTRVQREYAATITKIITELRDTSLRWRQETPLVQQLSRVDFGTHMNQFFMDFYFTYSGRMKIAEDAFKAEIANDNPFIKSHGLYQKKLAMEAVVTEMVNVFMSVDEPHRHAYVLGFYRWLVLGDKTPKLDRLVCQPNGSGLSVLDLLLEALEHFGIQPTHGGEL